MKGDRLTVEGWQVREEQVRELAAKVGVPANMPVPEVIVVGKEANREYQKGPQIQVDTSGLSPSGYFITIPESMLERVDKTSYILGSRTEQNIRHELAHYLEYLKPGASIGQDVDPYTQAVKEVAADLRGEVKNLALALSRQAWNLRDDYNLSGEEAFRLVARAAYNLGVSRSTVSRAKELYRSNIRE